MNKPKIIYWTGTTGWEYKEDAEIYSEISGLPIEIEYEPNTQLELDL